MGYFLALVCCGSLSSWGIGHYSVCLGVAQASTKCCARKFKNQYLPFSNFDALSLLSIGPSLLVSFYFTRLS